VRVVAGSARGRRLIAPTGERTRPTSDRVREAVFNSLGSQGVLDAAFVVDLFAGTGALGIEALSRGAEHAWFVEHDRAALDALRDNLRSTGLEGRATVEAVPVDRALAPGGPLVEVAADLIVADPPYSFDGWEALCAVAFARWPAALLVAESDRPVEIDPAGGTGRLVASRRYGTTVVSFLRGGVEVDEQDPEPGRPG
jgi:16S rRNA (guanine966-N2)-methyltransferase